jgi:hypothetical protein
LAYLFTVARAIQDASTKKWSYIDTFYNINIPKELEYILSDFSVVGKINDVMSGSTKSEVKIIGPDRKVFSKVELSGFLQEGDTDLVANFNLLKFQKPGIYYLKISINGVALEDDNKYYFKVIKQQ